MTLATLRSADAPLRGTILWVALLLTAVVIADVPDDSPECDALGWRVLLADHFEGPALDPAQWTAISENDFRSRAQDLVRGVFPQPDHVLRLTADTLGTDDRTVKRFGIASVQSFDTREPLEISFVIDWIDHADASDLSAAAYLAPERARTSAESLASWLKIEYVGVPPGSAARALIATNDRGRLNLLETEGWPERQRTGRHIGRQRLKMLLDRGMLSVLENALPLYSSREAAVAFPRVFLHLEMSTGANYPARSVTFDDVIVRARCG